MEDYRFLFFWQGNCEIILLSQNEMVYVGKCRQLCGTSVGCAYTAHTRSGRGEHWNAHAKQWVRHTATKMASFWWGAPKEYSPQVNSQAQRQTLNKSCKKSNISSKRKPTPCNNEKVRLRDCRRGQLLLARQGSARCLSHIQQRKHFVRG